MKLNPKPKTLAIVGADAEFPKNAIDGVHAEVLWVDRFGNCQLNVGPDDLPPGVEVWTVTIGDE